MGKRHHFFRNIIMSAVLFTLCLLLGGQVFATEKRNVKVAFFPMDGYHTIDENGNFGGMDVKYLDKVCDYAAWKIEYVKCDSWDEALAMLEKKEVDLVGSAQYSKERAESYQYAELSSGYTFGVIATDANKNIAYEDFQAMQNLVFGMVDTYVRKTEFLEYLSHNGIEHPTILEYPSTAKMQEALENGEIDAFVHTFTEVKDGQRLIGRFAPRPFYYITYQGNEELLEELNQAIVDVKMNYPELETELMNQFYYNKFDKTVLLTTEEKAYLQEKKTLQIGYLDQYYPFSYTENDTFKGLTRELLESGLSMTGLELQYKYYSSRQQAREALKCGEIDILAYSLDGENVLKENNLKSICDYAQVPLVLVSDKATNIDEIHILGTASFLEDKVKLVAINEDVQVVTYENLQQCLDAVVEGSVDGILCDGYFAEHHMRTSLSYSDLQIKNVLNGDYTISIAIAKNQETLAQILEKTISDIDFKMLNEYMLRENTYPLMSFTEFVKDNSLIIISVIIIIMLLVIFVIGSMLSKSQKIQKLMYKDTKMNVWNLHYLTYWGEDKLLPERKNNYSIVSLNLSKFRRYNVIYGWNSGDYLLEKMLEVLKSKIDATTEICARNQGDRFVLLLHYDKKEDFLTRLEDIKHSIENRIQKESGDMMNLKMGVYLIPEKEIDIRLGMDYANQALELSDNHTENGIQIYDSSLKSLIKERHDREKLLESVDFGKDFVAYYQPKVDIRNGRIIGAEALVRFKDPTENGMIRAPYFFVPYYEQTGKITELDFFILESVCKMLRRRMDAGLSVVTVSCNFSRIHFMKKGFIERFEATLNQYSIPKELIEAEVTETLVMEGIEHDLVKETFMELNERGVKLSIDDFGAGYSSLGVLEQIPASVVKMDRSFFLNQDNPERQVKIMRGIVNLSKELEAQIVCEGVETEKDVNLMKEIGAYVAQGYYYSKPIPEEEFEEKLDG